MSIELFASTYKWSASIDKTKAYTHEAVYLKYICEFSDKSELYTIDFNPFKNHEKYSLKLLAESENIRQDKRVNTYEFVAFLTQKGKVDFAFDVVMKKTTQESIDSTIGGRDNDREHEEFSQKIIKLKTLSVDVSETNSTLFGSFKITLHNDTHRVKAYQPYHMEIIVEGVGNMQDIKPLSFDIKRVKTFSSKPSLDIKLTKEGFRGRWSQKFAFTSDLNFTIPKISLEYFDKDTKQIQKLQTRSIDVGVVAGYKKEELLDVEEEKFRFDYTYLYYVLTFIAGFLLAKIKIKQRVPPVGVDEIFLKKVSDANSLEELAIILTLYDAKKYTQLILEIEKGKSKQLKELKKELSN